MEGPDDCFEHHACQFLEYSDIADLGCFCTHCHAASSRRCRCWGPPTSLFLVSRVMREVAQTVFFSRNRFIIQTGEEDWFVPQSTPDHLEAAIFLKDVVPPSHLSCVHFLELVFPRLDPSFFTFGESADIDFTETIRYVNDKLNFPKLTLRVCFRNKLMPSDPDYIPETLASEDGREIQQAYFRILAPLVRLRQPRRFFVHVGWLDEECYSEDIADLERKLVQCMVSAFESIWLC